MKLSKGETILIRNRQPRLEAEILGPSFASERKGSISFKEKQTNKRRNISFVQYNLKWHAMKNLWDVILNSRLPGRPGTSVNLVETLCNHLQVCCFVLLILCISQNLNVILLLFLLSSMSNYNSI